MNARLIVFLVLSLVFLVLIAFPSHPLKCSDCNLIIISVDTLRQDYVGLYGAGGGLTPNIDSFFGSQILFNNHFTPTSQTLPAHTSMFSGLHPVGHKALRNGVEINDSLVMLSEILGGNDFSSYAVISAFPLSSSNNFDQGFDVYIEPKGDEAVFTADVVSDISTNLLDEIAELEDGRFFLFIHFFDAHLPYEAPVEFNKWGSGWGGNYSGEVHFVDHHLKAIFSKITDLGLLDDTLVVLTSDHGESLGEHGYVGHGRPLYDNCVKVPFLVRHPDNVGLNFSQMTSHIDLVPTLLSILDVDSTLVFDGLDVFSNEINSREHLFLMRNFHNDQYNATDCSRRFKKSFECGEKYAIRGDDYKYIQATRYPNEFYNLSSDPGELENLIDVGSTLIHEKSQILDEWIKNHPVSNEDLTSIDEVGLEKLKDLGYIS